MGAIALTLGNGAMRIGRGVGAAAATLGDVAVGLTVRDGGMVGSGRGFSGSSTGGGCGGRGSTEGARVDAGSVGVEINVEKISAMSWIACKYSSLRVEKGVAGEVLVRAAVRAQAVAIYWLVE